MPGELIVDRPADGVLRLAISNPAKRNALDHEILAAITAELSALRDVRCVILTGHGGMFSSGYDIGELDPETFADEAEKLVAHPFCSALAELDATDVPTLAVLTGSTIGGGLELALACDLRLVLAQLAGQSGDRILQRQAVARDDRHARPAACGGLCGAALRASLRA